MKEEQPVPAEISPRDLLSLTAFQVLQNCSDGLTNRESGMQIGIDSKTVESYRHSLGFTELGHGGEYSRPNDYPNQSRVVTMALIQDGINYGYLSHELPIAPIRPLTPTEGVIAENLCQGFRQTEITQLLGISRKTVEMHTRKIRRKLVADNDYHIVARITSLKLNCRYVVNEPRVNKKFKLNTT